MKIRTALVRELGFAVAQVKPEQRLGSKLNHEIDVTEPILVSGKARGRRDA